LGIAGYSECFINQTSFTGNLGQIFTASERVTLGISQSLFDNNTFYEGTQTISISLMAFGAINQCIFIDQKGVSDGYLLSIFNTWKSANSLVFEVFF